MKRFYPDFESIDSLTLSLNFHQNELECTHCLKNDQFVSHGVIYKQRSSTFSEKVGKRIFCSNRYGRTGCGRTFQLYTADEVPSLRYGAAHLFVFITSLLMGQTVCNAYYHATEKLESRNAWRWLNKLMFKLSEYRSFLKVRINNNLNQFSSTRKNLRHLLPTLSRLFPPSFNACFDYQLRQQYSFL